MGGKTSLPGLAVKEKERMGVEQRSRRRRRRGWEEGWEVCMMSKPIAFVTVVSQRLASQFAKGRHLGPCALLSSLPSCHTTLDQISRVRTLHLNKKRTTRTTLHDGRKRPYRREKRWVMRRSEGRDVVVDSVPGVLGDAFGDPGQTSDLLLFEL